MMAIILSMLSLFASFEQIGTQLEDFIYRFLVPTAGDEVRAYLDEFAGKASRLTLFGLVFFLITALVLLFTIEESFNDIWRLNKGRSLGQRIITYWALISLGPILMGVSLSISTYLLSTNVMEDFGYVKKAQSFGVLALPILFEVLAFLLLYLVMPNVKLKFRHALVGAMVATILFELSKAAFAFYVSNLANYELVYGALATLPIFLIWVYLSWLVALVGAEVVAALSENYQLESKSWSARASQSASHEQVVPDQLNQD
jgi:membrane protein